MAVEPVFLRRAQADVEKIYQFIASRSSAGASRWYSALGEAVNSLARDPNRCAAAESVRLNGGFAASTLAEPPTQSAAPFTASWRSFSRPSA